MIWSCEKEGWHFHTVLGDPILIVKEDAAKIYKKY